MENLLTNNALAREHNTTPRQISKSRKRGYITTKDGVKKSFTAPRPVYVVTPKTSHKRKA